VITVIAGGVGAARFLAGLLLVVDPSEVTAIVNVGDDTDLHGLHISPDLDTVTYTLAGEINPDTGWGLRGETWSAMDMVRRYRGATWFQLGDRDLGTHIYRTGRLRDGATLSEVTAEITTGWDLGVRVIPATDDHLRTMVTVVDADAEREVTFQEYFVQRHHDVVVTALRFEGASSAKPAPGVIDALADAEAVVIAPSNPLVSIGPVLAVPGVRKALAAHIDRTVAISPIIAGAALKGPADRMLRELGHDASVVGVAELYASLAAALVIDEADAALADAVEATGLRAIVAPTVMSTPAAAANLAEVTLQAVGVR
jgi:LPPG:FO 2-phospho-L-lactate transferase